jgi:predicted alpha/beta-hydrolase family hydrolase
MLPTEPKLLIDGPRQASQTIVLAHGAGAGMDSEFMQAMAEGLAGYGLKVARFEFPYMIQRREVGTRRPPDREPALRESWLEVIELFESDSLIIGGKSMGGRIASLIADEARVSGLVCLGYPFHPSGKPDKLRTVHLKAIKTPTLIVQGERDALGNKEDVAGYTLSKKIQFHWLPDGDHSFKPRKISGQSQEGNWNDAIRMVAEFAQLLPAKKGGDHIP